MQHSYPILQRYDYIYIQQNMNTLKHITTYDFCKMFCSKVKNVKLVWTCVEIGKCFGFENEL